MIVKILCNVENVEGYTGKNGFGANVTVSQLIDKKRSLLTFSTKNEEIAKKLENYLQEKVDLEIELNQSNFGLRMGEVISCKAFSNSVSNSK